MADPTLPPPAPVAPPLAAPAPAPVEPKVRMLDTQTGKYVKVPQADVEKATRAGYARAEQHGVVNTAALGATQGATLGFGDELYGAAAAVPEALKQGTALFTDPEARASVARKYAQERNNARRLLAEAHDDNPGTYSTAEAVGGLATAPALPTNVRGAAAAGGALGGLAGLGYSNADSVVDRAKDAVVGAAVGSAIPAATEVLGSGIRAGGRALSEYAPKALLESTGMTPKQLGVGTRAEANQMAARAMKEPGLIPPLGKPATAESVAESAMASSDALGEKYGAILREIDAKHGRPVLKLWDLAKEVAGRTREAVKNEPNWEQYVQKAIRALDPERYDAFYEHLGPVSKGSEAWLKREPWYAYAPTAKITLEAAHEAGQRIRGYGTKYPGPLDPQAKAAIGAEIYSPAKTAIGSFLREESPAVGNAGERFGFHQDIENAAKQANNWKNPGTPLKALVGTLAASGAGAAVGGVPGAMVGAAVPPLAAGLKPHIPRLAEAVGPMLAKPRPAFAEGVNRVSTSLARVLGNSPPDKQAQVDLLLQERSPKYRKMRQEEEKKGAD